MSFSAPTFATWVTLGRIVGLFGVRGQLKVESYTAPPEGLLRYPQWRLECTGGRIESRRLLEGRAKGRQLVVSLEGVEDCDAARALIGAHAQVARAEMPRLAEREYYQVDLIGLRVLNAGGEELGRVAHFLEMPAHPVMVVRGGGKEHWLPVTPQHLLNVDLEAGEIRVNWDLAEAAG